LLLNTHIENRQVDQIDVFQEHMHKCQLNVHLCKEEEEGSLRKLFLQYLSMLH
jgi:hypothetical protein